MTVRCGGGACRVRHDGPMQVTHTAAYAAAPAEVYAMLTDPAFREHAATASGVLEVTVTVTPGSGGHGHVVVLDQVQPTAGLPSFARKFAGETTRAVVTETWDSPASATLTVRTPGRPTDITGAYELVESDGGTLQTFSGEVKVKVPLIKDKLERLMTQIFLDARDKEQAAGAAWLRGER
jgi:hypothetical protein